MLFHIQYTNDIVNHWENKFTCATKTSGLDVYVFDFKDTPVHGLQALRSLKLLYQALFLFCR